MEPYPDAGPGGLAQRHGAFVDSDHDAPPDSLPRRHDPAVVNGGEPPIVCDQDCGDARQAILEKRRLRSL